MISSPPPRIAPAPGACLALLLLCATFAAARADSAAGDPAASLADQATAAVGQFRAITPADIESARAELRTASDTLEAAFPTSQRAAWLEYLNWDAVRPQLDPGADLDLRVLQSTYDRLTCGERGLERPEFAAVAAASRRLLDLGLVRRSKDPAAYLDRQAQVLARYLERDPTGADPRASYQIERRLSLFVGLDQASELTAAMRDELGSPNLLGSVSEELLALIAARPVDETRPVRDTILGTCVVGDGHTRGRISLQLEPSPTAARIRFLLHGKVASLTRGYNGPVVIRTAGDTQFHGGKVVELTDDRFRVLPADLDAATTSQTRSIRKRGGRLGKRLIESIAKKKVAESRGQANAIASRKAERQIGDEFNSEVAAEVRTARNKYDESLTRPLRRRAAEPQRVALSTTDDTLFLSALQASDRQLGAPGEAPPALAGDLSLRLHQSALNNLADAFAGGASFRRTAADQPPEIDAVLPDRLLEAIAKQSADREPTPGPFRAWEIELRRARPISFVIDDGVVRALVHTARIVSGDEAFRGWDIEVTYRPVRDGDRWFVELVGELDAFPTRFDPAAPGARLDSKQRAIRRNLAKQLTARSLEDPNFPRRPELTPIDLAKLAKPGLNGLIITDIRADDGWLSVSLDAQ